MSSCSEHAAAVQQAWRASAPWYPRVTVQLPIYNERYVIERLVEAVVCLRCPRAQSEIQILDDSTDETTAIAIRLAERYRHLGFAITVQHRPHRHGYKAGALAEGLTRATGEFIAIFDADFVPAPDFLLYTLGFAAVAGLSLHERFQMARLHMPSRARARVAAARRR